MKRRGGNEEINVQHQPEEKRFIRLGWELLEHKYRYYILNCPIVTDYEYDVLEKEYDGLALKLGLEPSVSNMVGFNINKPCCDLVARKVETSRWKK